MRWKTQIQILNKILRKIQVLTRFQRFKNTRNTYGNVSDSLDRVSFSSRSKNGSQKNGFLLFSGLFANLWSSVQLYISGLLFLWHCFSHNCGIHFLPRWRFELLVPSHRYRPFNFLPLHSPTIARRNYNHQQIFHLIWLRCTMIDWKVCTAKRIQDRSMISSIKPKFGLPLFVDFHVFCKILT